MASTQASEPKWYDPLPEPRSKPKQMTSEELHALLQKDDHKVLVVDVRRTDIEVSRVDRVSNDELSGSHLWHS